MTFGGKAIAGIGSDNVIGIPVDNAARLDIGELEKRLEESLANEQPIFAVVAIMGSTEGKISHCPNYIADS
jgi:hypothetical protein